MKTADQIEVGILDNELHFSFSKSSGPGGQSVNKLNTKAALRFHLDSSSILREDQKEILKKKLAARLNHEGELVLTSQESRSQLENKQLVIKKFYELLNKSLKKPKWRVKTKATKASKEKRIQQKKEQSEKKSRRKWNE